jgi:hypothetical protein
MIYSGHLSEASLASDGLTTYMRRDSDNAHLLLLLLCMLCATIAMASLKFGPHLNDSTIWHMNK